MPSSSSICGGVSVGEHDHVKAALASLGVDAGLLAGGAEAGQADLVRHGPRRHAGLRPAGQPRLRDGHLPALRPPGDPGVCSAAEASGSSAPRRRSIEDLPEAAPGAPTRSAARLELRDDGWHARPTGEPGLARPHLDARRRRAGDRARRRAIRPWPASRSRSSCCRRLGSSIASMTVTVRLFAILRERAGSDSIEVELDEGATVAEALEQLAARPELERAARADAGADGRQPRLRGSRTRRSPPATSWRWCRRSAAATRDRVHVRITDGPLSLESLSALVSPPRGRRDRHLPGHDARGRQPRLRGLPRDGRGADRRDPRASASSATAWPPRPPSTGSAPSRWASRA